MKKIAVVSRSQKDLWGLITLLHLLVADKCAEEGCWVSFIQPGDGPDGTSLGPDFRRHADLEAFMMHTEKARQTLEAAGLMKGTVFAMTHGAVDFHGRPVSAGPFSELMTYIDDGQPADFVILDFPGCDGTGADELVLLREAFLGAGRRGGYCAVMPYPGSPECEAWKAASGWDEARDGAVMPREALYRSRATYMPFARRLYEALGF